MSSSDAMFVVSSVHFQYVNEGAAHVKIDCVSCWCRLSGNKSLISLVVEWFSTTAIL